MKKKIYLLIGLVIIAFIGYVIYQEMTWKPLTYNDAYDEAQWQIKRLCKESQRKPCDYKLVNVSTKEMHYSHWVFDFQSKHHQPISILIENDGDVDIGIN